MSSFEKTRHFPTLSGSNKMKSFEISIVCTQTRLRLRAVSSAKLDCGWRICIANSIVSAANEVLVESTALFNCYFQNSTFRLYNSSMKSINNFFSAIFSFIKRYPIMSFVSVFVFSASCLYIFQKTEADSVFIRILCGSVLSAVFCLLSMFITENKTASSVITKSFKTFDSYALQNVFSFLLSMLGFFAGFLFMYFKNYESYSYMRFFGLISVCSALIVFLYSQREEMPISVLVRDFLVSIQISLILFAALSIVIAAVYFLFFRGIAAIEKIYYTAFALCSSIVFLHIFTSMLFGGVKDFDKTGKIFKVVMVYVLLPVYAALLVVLYIYLAKVCIVRKLQTNWFISLASAAFIFFYFCLTEYKENTLVKLFYKAGKFILIPLFVIQCIAFAVRINEYGFTAPRYFSLAYIIFSIVFTVITIVKNDMFAKYGFLLLSAFIFISTLTPFNALNMSYKNQLHRMTSILSKAGLYEKSSGVKKVSDAEDIISKDDMQKLRSAYNFLRRDKKRPEWIKDSAVDTFGFEIKSEEYSPCKNMKFFNYEMYSKSADIKGFNKLFTFEQYLYSNEKSTIELSIKAGGKEYDISEFLLTLDEDKEYESISYTAPDGNNIIFTDLSYSYDNDKKKYTRLSMTGFVLFK